MVMEGSIHFVACTRDHIRRITIPLGDSPVDAIRTLTLFKGGTGEVDVHHLLRAYSHRLAVGLSSYYVLTIVRYGLQRDGRRDSALTKIQRFKCPGLLEEGFQDRLLYDEYSQRVVVMDGIQVFTLRTHLEGQEPQEPDDEGEEGMRH
ncbi:hypothetical protein NMY22_g10785 [Coprinellus aureogranulatus]|nr:hypothetical protein NMY22_g10785 [Coprinellus aureogranulatus]